MKLVLASTSPRRHELLGRLGVPFEIADPGQVEGPHGPPGPLARARWAAAEKARAVAAGRREAVVLGADTMISVGGRALGKPADEEDARRMLRLLSDRTHAVYSAVHVVGPVGREAAGHSRSLLTLRRLREADIERYLGYGESLDKAGAYSIQGHGEELLVRRVGPLDNVIGLPLAVVRRLLSRVAA